MSNFIIPKLAEYFEKLPGIGPRQAVRFVYWLLTKDEEFLNNFSGLISELKKNSRRCVKCQKFLINDGKNSECEICRKPGRSKNSLLIIEKDIDLENMEKAGSYDGLYFVLGGLVPILGKELPKEIKAKELFERVKKDATAGILKEVILALNATSEGDNTCRYVEKILEPIAQKSGIKISRLGRGLSTGTELEYSDSETLVHAFKNRK